MRLNFINQLTNTTVSLHHVYGHQDTCPRDRLEPLDSPATSDTSIDNEDFMMAPVMRRNKQLSRPAQLNIICDEIANEMARHVMDQSSPNNETLGMPLPGSKALVQIGTKLINSKLDHHLLRAAHSDELHCYCCVKYRWPHIILDAIAWEVIRLACANQSWSTLMHMSKIMHGWLPVMKLREWRGFSFLVRFGADLFILFSFPARSQFSKKMHVTTRGSSHFRPFLVSSFFDGLRYGYAVIPRPLHLHLTLATSASTMTKYCRSSSLVVTTIMDELRE